MMYRLILENLKDRHTHHVFGFVNGFYMRLNTTTPQLFILGSWKLRRFRFVFSWLRVVPLNVLYISRLKYCGGSLPSQLIENVFEMKFPLYRSRKFLSIDSISGLSRVSIFVKKLVQRVTSGGWKATSLNIYYSRNTGSSLRYHS